MAASVWGWELFGIWPRVFGIGSYQVLAASVWERELLRIWLRVFGVGKLLRICPRVFGIGNYLRSGRECSGSANYWGSGRECLGSGIIGDLAASDVRWMSHPDCIVRCAATSCELLAFDVGWIPLTHASRGTK
jgi:hypothetical protein